MYFLLVEFSVINICAYYIRQTLTIHLYSILFVQREHHLALRFEDECADRTQPPPNIPDGPAHK